MTKAPATTAECLLAAVLDRPEDDAPRLAYADWLDEHGEPERGEFIRVQVELHPMLKDPRVAHVPGVSEMCGCRYCRLRNREHDLWNLRAGDRFVVAGDAGAILGGRCHVLLPTDSYASANDPHGLPSLIFRRGFVDELRCPLAAFLGGDCPACWGTGDLGTLGGRIGCNVCSDTWSKRGTGRAPGAAAVCRVEPVTKVVLVGCEPYENSSGQWQWYDARRTNQTIHPQSDLPGELWDLLKQPARGVQKDHPTRDDALDALSRACIRWARGQGPA
jgi:uncharacterized protein (TIGR02996 family)